MVLIIIGSNVIAFEGAPLADFTYYPDPPVVDEEIEFDASGSSGEGLQYIWDFGDGHEARGMIVNHTYREVGVYTVVLVVINSTGGADTYSESIYVGSEMEGTFILLILVFYLLIFCGFALIMALLSATNLILGGILAYRVYTKAKKSDRMDTAKPYLIAHLISGIIGFFYYPVVIFSIIGHIVIFILFKNKMHDMDLETKKCSRIKRKT